MFSDWNDVFITVQELFNSLGMLGCAHGSGPSHLNWTFN